MMKLTNAVALEIALTAIDAAGMNEYRMAGTDVTFSAEEAKTKLMKMMEQLEKKSSAEKKPTKTQMENGALADALYDEMLADGGKLTVSDMLAKFDCVKGMSNQKVSAIVRKLKDTGKVAKDIEGRKSFFSAVA